MNGHIYQRLELDRVEVTDLDGHVSMFDDEGNWIDGPQTQADPHLCKWVGGTMLPGHGRRAAHASRPARRRCGPAAPVLSGLDRRGSARDLSQAVRRR